MRLLITRDLRWVAGMLLATIGCGGPGGTSPAIGRGTGGAESTSTGGQTGSTGGRFGAAGGGPAPLFAHHLRVRPLGDSITAGLSDDSSSPTGGYRGPLLTLLNVHPDAQSVEFVGTQATPAPASHEGHPGIGTVGVVANLATWIKAAPADVTLLMIGTNDLGYTEEAVAVAAEMSGIVEPALAVGEVVFVATLIPNGGKDRDIPTRWTNYNNILTAQVQSHAGYGTRLFLVGAMSSALTLGTPDYEPTSTIQVHPNPPGYAKMAAVWATSMRGVVSP